MPYTYDRMADTSAGSTLRNAAHTLQGAAREMGKARYTLQGLEAQMGLKAKSTHDKTLARDYAAVQGLHERYERLLKELNGLAHDADEVGRRLR